MTSELNPGSLLDRRFEIAAVIGRGALTTVYEAKDLRSDERVAVKVPSPGCLREPLFRMRFEREAKIGAKLRHPSVVRFIPVDSRSRPYIVMELLEGRPLSELQREGVPMPLDQALDIASRVAQALEYLHSRQVIHRDVKPANVFLCRDRSLRLVDLGLAWEGEGPEPGAAISQAFGTPDYMPPEQVRGKSGDRRSDIYALGAMLYEMATGVPPFQSDDPFVVMQARVVGDPAAPRLRNPSIPPQVEEIILHAMERDPGRRYARAEEFRKDLDHLQEVSLTGRASRLVPPAAWKILWRRVQDFVWALLAIALFYAVMVFVAQTWGRFPWRK